MLQSFINDSESDRTNLLCIRSMIYDINILILIINYKQIYIYIIYTIYTIYNIKVC